jgi:uncharacterized protein YbaA (DUF1428 family)
LISFSAAETVQYILGGTEMPYVDGFVIAIPKKKIEAYRKMSQRAGKIWREFGAIQYVETVGDDLNIKGVVSFSKMMNTKPGETVVFSWIVYKSRGHRDRVNAKIMKDPRIHKMMENTPMPFDMRRMVYGGFKFLVNIEEPKR